MLPSCRSRSFEPRSALITGATSGIGAAFARALPSTTGVVLVARDAEALDRIRGELATPGRRIDTVAADLATGEGRERVVAAAEAAEIDLLINNAGSGRFGPFLDAASGQSEAALELNVVALTALCRALLPGMIGRAGASSGRAALVNVASTAAFVPVPQLAVYAASKAYVLSLTEALAVELAREPVEVLAVCPGATRSDFARRAGFQGGDLPGAIDPKVVAEKVLTAIGRRSVVYTDFPSEAALTPLTRLRAATAGAVGLGVNLMRRRLSA